VKLLYASVQYQVSKLDSADVKIISRKKTKTKKKLNNGCIMLRNCWKVHCDPCEANA